jgi:hypothetical protein
MAAFLLAWNPERFQWGSLPKDIDRVQRKGFINERWSCGNRTDLPKGSEFFLIRLGPAPKGIVGRGVTVSEPAEDKHWDPDKRRQKAKALYVKVRFTDLSESPVIPWAALQLPPLSRFKWSIFASGVALPEVVVGELDRLWTYGKTQLSTVGRPEVLARHPFSDEIRSDIAILQDPELLETEKQAIILARRGQGRFRDGVASAEPRCRVTGVADLNVLRASHIKPWREASNEERISGDNGLMLAPHVGHLFDQGYISFADVGDILVSPHCPAGVLSAWGISPTANVGPFRTGQRPFLAHHRKYVFKS